MIDIAFIIIYIATEITIYCLGYNVIMGRKLSDDRFRWCVAITCVVAIHIVLLFAVDAEASEALSFVTMIVIPTALLAKFEWINVLLYPFVIMSTSTMAICASFFLALCFKQPEYVIVGDRVATIISQCVPIAVLGGWSLLKKIKKGDFYQLEIDSRQLLIIYIQVVSIFLLLAPLQSLSRLSDDGDVTVVGLSSSILCLLLLTVTLWQINSSNNERHQKQVNNLLETQMELQKDYYSKLIRQDQLMRTFKHKLRAHVEVINAYCLEQDISKIKEYLDQIIEKSAVNDIKTYTGNYEVDAIIRSFTERAAQNHILINVSGCIPQNSIVVVYDLCSLVYNLLKNAIEACEKIPDYDNRKIDMKVGEYNSQFYLEISNTVVRKIEVNNYTISSTKENSKDHGIGINTVKSIVKKYGGIVKASCDEKRFKVEIYT